MLKHSKPYIQYACGMCGERFDTTEEAVKHCSSFEWDGYGPRYTEEVTSCCGSEIGEGTYREYPLGRNEPGYIDYPIPVCCDCGKELEE